MKNILKKLRFFIPFFLGGCVMSFANIVISANVNETEKVKKLEKSEIEKDIDNLKRDFDLQDQDFDVSIDSFYDKFSKKNNEKNMKVVEIYDNRYCIPINILNNSGKDVSPFLKSVILDVIIKKLKESKLLNESFFVEEGNLNNEYDLFSILINNNFKPQLNLKVNKESYNDLKRVVDGEKFKDFVKDIKVTKADFDYSKKRIADYIKRTRDNLELSLKDLDKNGRKIEITSFLNYFPSNKQIDKLSAYYNHFISHILKEFDEKLYNHINSKVQNSKFDNSYFKNSYEYLLKNKKNLLNNSLENLKEKDSEILNNLKFDDEVKNLNIRSENLKQDKTYANSKNRVYLEGVDGVVNYLDYWYLEIPVGFFDALNLDNHEKETFLKYYEKKLQSIKNNNNFYEKNFKEFLKKLYSDEASFVKFLKEEGKDQKLKEYRSSLPEFLISFKSSIENYYAKFIEHINKNIVKHVDKN